VPQARRAGARRCPSHAPPATGLRLTLRRPAR